MDSEKVTEADRETYEGIFYVSPREGCPAAEETLQILARHRLASTEALREALRPFAKLAELLEPQTPDEYYPPWAEFIRAGDFRRARKALDTEGAANG